MDENMDDFAKDIETLQGFVGQPYNNCDQQEAEIRLFTELMGMIAILSKPQPLPELPNYHVEIQDLDKRLDNVSKLMVEMQERSTMKKRKMERLVNSVDKLAKDVERLSRRKVAVEKAIKEAVEKEVAKVFETE